MSEATNVSRKLVAVFAADVEGYMGIIILLHAGVCRPDFWRPDSISGVRGFWKRIGRRTLIKREIVD
ncbi:hypothetical protein V1289_009466 [Bradyrhizobium sp. AZCC 2289]